MRRLSAAGCLLLLMLAGAAACSAGHAGGGAQGALLPVVTYTPPNGPVPSDLVEASPFTLRGSVHAGFACFTMGGVPVDWPAGYSAVRGTDGTLEVRDNAGHLIRNRHAQYLQVLNIPSTGSACSGSGQMMTAILSLQDSL